MSHERRSRQFTTSDASPETSTEYPVLGTDRWVLRRRARPEGFLAWSSVAVLMFGGFIPCAPSVHLHAAEHLNEAMSSISRDDLARHLGFLASDSLEGREAGTRGGQAAAVYLVERLKALGCSPAGEDGDFVQEFGRGYRNVLGVIPGSDPGRSNEFILIGGHLDHVGYGNRLNSDGPLGRIHNGADDNASGVSAILEIAEALTKLGSPLPRSVVIAFWDGEEKGLLGSKHWVKEPTIDLSKIRLALNLDMVGRLSNETVTVYGSRTCVGLRQCVVRANEAAGLKLNFDRIQRDDSDHYSFYSKSIPYVMLFTGEHADYHRPSDDVERINFNGIEQIAKIYLKVLVEVAESDRPFAFRNDVRDEVRSRGVSFKSLPPRLGLSWPPDHKLGEPFPVIAVDDGSPAQAAGIQAGDRIIRVGDKAASEIAELRTFVAASRPELTMICERNGESVECRVVLKGSPTPPGAEIRIDPADESVLFVSSVEPGSDAAKAGLRSGDRIVLLNGAALNSWTIEREGRLKVITRD